MHAFQYFQLHFITIVSLILQENMGKNNTPVNARMTVVQKMNNLYRLTWGNFTRVADSILCYYCLARIPRSSLAKCLVWECILIKRGTAPSSLSSATHQARLGRECARGSEFCRQRATSLQSPRSASLVLPQRYPSFPAFYKLASALQVTVHCHRHTTNYQLSRNMEADVQKSSIFTVKKMYAGWSYVVLEPEKTWRHACAGILGGLLR